MNEILNVKLQCIVGQILKAILVFCISDSISKIFSSSCESKAQGFEFLGVEIVSFMSEPPTLITLETHQGQFSSVQSLSHVRLFATP